jgi:predicted nicotinamide N-methyase
VRTLIDAYTRIQRHHFVPEFRLHLADSLVPLWQATEERAGTPNPPPFWAFAWPGSLALARYLLDTPGVVAGRRVVDVGSGGGLAAIAAAARGAAHVLACDVDELATAAQLLNAQLNQVPLEAWTGDVTTRRLEVDPRVDVALAGDVCYEREPAHELVAWLRNLAAGGTLVLLADPGRHYTPSHGLELVATYDVPTLQELESLDHKRTRLWVVRP